MRRALLAAWITKFAVLFCLLAALCHGQVSVLTHHNDPARDGLNASETSLTLSNVSPGKFGKLFNLPVDSYVYAQPLYVPNVTIPGNGTHNVVYAATLNDSVYAYDADGLTLQPLWMVNLAALGCQSGWTCTAVPSTVNYLGASGPDIYPGVGILSTPVIDPATNTLYAVAKTQEISGSDTNYLYRLHALDISTGAEQTGSPVIIQGQVAGSGTPNNGGFLVFSPLYSLQRPGLVLANNGVYIGFGASADLSMWHGWIFGYDEFSLSQLAVFSVTPNGPEGHGGIWMHGDGLVADSDGNLYFTTGNGSFDGVANFSDSFLKLATPSLTVSDYFTPYNQYTFDNTDEDVAAGGLIQLPDSAGTTQYPHIMIGCSKTGTVYVIDRDNMGQYNSSGDTQIIQELPNLIGTDPFNPADPGYVEDCYSSPSYWNGSVYFGGVADSLKMFIFTNGLLSSSAVSQSAESYQFPGTSPSISANGSTNGIVWTIENAGNVVGPDLTATTAVLHAYDATNLSNELYNSSQVSSDSAGAPVKFATPTIANGKVYVGTQTSVAVYGLFSPTVISVSPNTGPLAGGTAVTITGTNFAAGAPVTFGSSAATNVTVVSGATITATTPAGSAGAVNVTVTVNGQSGTLNNGFTYTNAAGAPVITSATTASGTVGSAFSYQITASNTPTSYGATGLPAGLSVNSGTGLISGTPTTAATSTVTLSATNSGGTGSATLTLTINPGAPVITSATTASGTVGSAFSYQITASNTPTSYGATGLPAGLSANSGTGLISGTPTTAATSTVTLSATNSGGTGSATLTLTINNPAAPVITSATTASGTVGSAFSYQITASNTPTSYGATGLPAGLSVNSGTGLISGTPTTAATSTVTLSAINGGGTGTATLTLTIKPSSSFSSAQIIASASPGTAKSWSLSFPQNTVAGDLILVAFDYDTNATLSSVTDSQNNAFTAVGSQLTSPGQARSRVYYANSIKGGADTVTVNLSANSAWIELYLIEYTGVNQTNPIDVQAGASGNAGAVSSGNATTTAAGDLIFGYCVGDWACTAGSGFTTRSTFNNNLIEDKLVGNPGPYVATGSATNGWTMQMVALKPATTNPAVPVITSATTASGTVGSAFTYQITATNTPTSYGATGLPAGLSVNSGTGLISGTPTAAATSTVTLSAINGGGTGTATLTLTINNAVPVITSATTASGTVGSAFSYQITASNTPTSYGATGLPAGLSVNSGTGLISGTPTTAATSTVTLSATNSGGTGSATLTLTINPGAPVITSATTASGTVGSAFSYQITASNTPTSYGATGLPAGLSVNSGTGLISGTPTTAATSTVTLSAINGGGTGTATLTLTINNAVPVITSATTASGTVGSAFTYQITATNSPTSYGATGLPAGLSVNSGTGLISGTPTAAATSTVTLSAINGGGTGSATLTLTIKAAAPVITSASTASGTVGSAFSYQITASNTPTSYGATGLPAGLSVNSGTGLISGTPTTAATSTVTLSATNSGGTGSATLTLTINPGAPVITSATTASGTVGSAFSYQITASNTPTSYGATGLPAGLSVNSGTGLISGTPTTAATSTVTLSATNSGGTGSATLTLTINNPAAPVITSASTASGTVGSAFTYQITATNSPTSYGATGLPAGLSVNSGTGLISGTPTAAATSTVTLSAINGGGTGTATLTLTINNAVPVITSATTVSGTVGSAFTYQITATNSPTSYGATGLPAGLSVNSGTGLISGTPTAAATSTVTLSAINGGGTGTATLTLTINNAVPVITSATTASGTVGSAFSYQITASNTPTSYGATGLPAGLSVNSGTGLISGTPTAAATSTVTLSAINGGGTGTATLTLTIKPSSSFSSAQIIASASPGTAKSWSLSFPQNTVAGDLILVAFDYDTNATLSSVTDSQNNAFTAVGSQLTSPGQARSRVYYANSIKGGADTVTVNLSANSAWIELYLIEYTGVNQTNPIDVQAGASGNAGAVSSGNATTTAAGDLIFGYCVGDWACTAGSGFTTRSTFNNNLIEDKLVGNPGPYVATGSATNGWTMQMVALKPAAQ